MAVKLLVRRDTDPVPMAVYRLPHRGSCAHSVSLALALGLVVCSSHSSAAQPTLKTWTVSEVWRIDGTERGGEPLADPRDLAVLRDGTVWMLDFKDQQIRRFDANGRPLKPVGRQGSGPGEFKNANGMLVHPDGTVWVSDPLNARISVFSASGTVVRSIPAVIWGWRFRWEGWVDLATGNVADPQEAHAWRFIAPGGVAHETVARPSCAAGRPPTFEGFRAETPRQGAMMGPYPFTVGGGKAPTGRGALWCAEANSRTVALVRVGRGDTLAQTSIDIPPMVVPRGERDSVVAVLRTRISTYATNDFDESKVPFRKPGIALLTVDDDGRLWVQHAQRFGETGPTFDVHDARGQHLGRLTLPRPMHQAGWLPLKARGDFIWVVTVDADGVPEIAKYRITR